MTAAREAKDILGPDIESEFMASFVRVDLKDNDSDDMPKAVYMQPKLTKQSSDAPSDTSDKSQKKKGKGKSKKQKTPEYYEIMYTDKDRAAAVTIGSYDIKQSLSLKRRQDRNEALQIPEEADANTLYNIGIREMKNGNLLIAISSISKALELNPTDQNALITRSKCYLLLGEAQKGKDDAETALTLDKNNIRAIYQKAESLYYLGQFEQSLMYFHRGRQLRPDLNSFRLGVQKTQEAIENTLGGQPVVIQPPSLHRDMEELNVEDVRPKPRPKTSKAALAKRESRKLLGNLCVDKEYLENLLKHPHLKRYDTGTDNISDKAMDGLKFLESRQEFWRQQRPCTALPKKKSMLDSPLPRWY